VKDQILHGSNAHWGMGMKQHNARRLFLGVLTNVWPRVLGHDSAQQLLHRAMEDARDSGSHQINVSRDQTVTQQQPLSFAPQGAAVHLDIEGVVAGPDRARFSILPGGPQAGGRVAA